MRRVSLSVVRSASCHSPSHFHKLPCMKPPLWGGGLFLITLETPLWIVWQTHFPVYLRYINPNYISNIFYIIPSLSCSVSLYINCFHWISSLIPFLNINGFILYEHMNRALMIHLAVMRLFWVRFAPCQIGWAVCYTKNITGMKPFGFEKVEIYLWIRSVFGN